MSASSAGPRVRRFIAVSCGLAVLFAIPSPPAAAATPQRAPEDSRFSEWLDAVERHRPGVHDEPAVQILAWGAVDLERTLRRFRNLERRADFNALALRAATLHADIAMWQWDARQGVGQPPPTPGALAPGRSLILIVDGRFLSTNGVTVHWSLARSLIDALRPSPMGHEFARVWYKATLAYLIGKSSYTDAVAHIERAKQLFPRDAFFEVAAGCVHEAFASARILEGARAARAAGGGETARLVMPSAVTSLMTAESSFRRALELDLHLVEARLRLGRVLALRGQQSAVSHFEAVLNGTSDDTLRYYAFLFLGERREAMRQFAAAGDAYRTAALLFPRAQSPVVALSHLARRHGDRATALRLTGALDSLPEMRDAGDDPWWYYELGIGRDAEGLMADLHAALMKGPR